MWTWPEHPGLTRGLRTIKGVGPQIEQNLGKRGYKALGDLLFLMPVRYQDRRKTVPIVTLDEGDEALVAGEITEAKEARFSKDGQRYFELVVQDPSAHLHAMWFRFPAHLRATLSPGKKILLFGRITRYRKRLQMVHPEVVPWDGGDWPAPEIRPVYPDLDDVRPGTLRRVLAEAIRELDAVPAVFPLKWLKEKGLTDPTEAIRTLHDPPADATGRLPRPDESRAWRSMALFELLYIQLILARVRGRISRTAGQAYSPDSNLARAFIESLPFRLTPGQETAWREIQKDLADPRPMNRLLQGDVGCGKTVVALAAALTAVDGGRQAAVMAPTEVLARQHFLFFQPFAEKLGVRTALMIGGLKEKEKNGCREDVAAGRVDLVIGTQALIADCLEFDRLGLAIIDEQHRFGVAQRLALRAKANQPDLLIMTATPIPRSLALTLYGDLDLSVIADLPPGRTPVRTLAFGKDDRDRAYRVLAEEVQNGGLAFVVAPRIEAKEENGGLAEDLASAEALYEFVRTRIPKKASVGLVHGRMKPEDQQRVMTDFREGHLRTLVATTVIEVGLDVPGASLILIEGAERFGLAQLHQLRGRVGRGRRPSACLLVTGEESEHSNARIEALVRSRDGFVLAEEDLRLRGPGDPIGFRQSGLPPLAWASLPRDLPLLLKARDLASEIVEKDPELSAPEFKLVREVIDHLEEQVAKAVPLVEAIAS